MKSARPKYLVLVQKWMPKADRRDSIFRTVDVDSSH
jgi:hypothetical protein